MEKYCEKLLNILKLELFNYAILIVLCIIAVIVCLLLRSKKKYRILFWVSGICLTVSVLLSFIEILPIYHDYQNKSFVQLENVLIVSKTSSGFDSSGFRGISVYVSNDNMLHLKTTVQFEKGQYKGNVVYSERSGYLVDWVESEE